MIESIIFGLTIGGILYVVSIGLSITFGIMKIVNFSHGAIYALTTYIFVFLLRHNFNYFASFIIAVCLIIPLSYLIERFILRRLYGVSIDYALIATYGLLLISTDIIKWIWGTSAWNVNVPTTITVNILHVNIPLYRLIIIIASVVVFIGLSLFFSKTIAGKVISASLDDSDGVSCLGINRFKYFSLVFIIGSVLAGIGGILYAPISAAEPYMGYRFILLSFAVVIISGMGNIKGTFYSSFALGLLISLSGRVLPKLSEMLVFLVMAIVLLVKKSEKI